MGFKKLLFFIILYLLLIYSETRKRETSFNENVAEKSTKKGRKLDLHTPHATYVPTPISILNKEKKTNSEQTTLPQKCLEQKRSVAQINVDHKKSIEHKEIMGQKYSIEQKETVEPKKIIVQKNVEQKKGIEQKTIVEQKENSEQKISLKQKTSAEQKMEQRNLDPIICLVLLYDC